MKSEDIRSRTFSVPTLFYKVDIFYVDSRIGTPYANVPYTCIYTFQVSCSTGVTTPSVYTFHERNSEVVTPKSLLRSSTVSSYNRTVLSDVFTGVITFGPHPIGVSKDLSEQSCSRRSVSLSLTSVTPVSYRLSPVLFRLDFLRVS